jgi:Na+-transporting NADH:ubiquinone oxidoreductase subunit C
MHSNRYIFLYASAMVVVVAILLASASIQLKPFQEKNVRLEKMSNILAAVNIPSDASNVEVLYARYITSTIVINIKGEADGSDAFDVELRDELKKDKDRQRFPMFICTRDNKEEYTIIPVRGKGLWGPVWGYIALESDMNTIFGATFDHKSETPGLGAEINQPFFQNQFAGKKLFDEAMQFSSVKVIKGGAGADNPHGVDAISGGTITSDGVSAMLRDCLSNYVSYLNNKRSQS